MSLNERQFEAVQLPMFMRTRDVIDNVHKIDSHHHPEWGQRERRTPREQWEAPDAEYDESLREMKQSGHSRMIVSKDQALPVTIYNYGGRVPTLADGHHRLAAHEALGHTWIPVKHRDTPVWGREDW